MEEVGGFWTRFQGKQRGKQSSLSLYKGGTVENWVFLSSQQPLSKLSCNNPHSSPPPPPPSPMEHHRFCYRLPRLFKDFTVTFHGVLTVPGLWSQEHKNFSPAKKKQSKPQKTKKEAYKKRTNKKSDEKTKTKKENCEIFEVLRNKSYQKLAESSAFNLYRKKFLLLIL